MIDAEVVEENSHVDVVEECLEARDIWKNSGCVSYMYELLFGMWETLVQT